MPYTHIDAYTCLLLVGLLKCEIRYVWNVKFIHSRHKNYRSLVEYKADLYVE